MLLIKNVINDITQPQLCHILFLLIELALLPPFQKCGSSALLSDTSVACEQSSRQFITGPHREANHHSQSHLQMNQTCNQSCQFSSRAFRQSVGGRQSTRTEVRQKKCKGENIDKGY